MTSKPSATARKKLLTVWPQKGGIGKSFVATLLYDHLKDRGVPVQAFDLDHANSTFRRYVAEAEFIDTDVDGDKLAVLDQLVHSLTDGDARFVLADNRAAGGEKLERWLEECDLVESQERLGFDLVFVTVLVDDKDSISQVANLVETYGNRVRWLGTRNLREGPRLPIFDESATRKKLLAQGAVEINVPCLAEITRNRLQLANLTVSRGRTAEQLPVLDRSRCVRFHHKMAEEFRKAEALLFS
ncbi:MAG: division plane positioning ATPase MipZ [Opitutaceae bacterium]|nr:division plane positioning ATPase MipZ [Opitutaceae bacterium]